MAKKGCRHIYNKIYCQTFESKYKDKGISDLDLQIDKFTWRRISYICFKPVYNNYLVWIQYKTLHCILGTQRIMMFHMKITGSNLCRLCNSCSETIMHLFVNCNHVVKLCRDLEKWLKIAINIGYTFTTKDIVLGYLLTSTFGAPINVIIMVTNKYIFSCACINVTPNIQQLKQKLTAIFEDERLAYEDRDMKHIFLKKWEKMLILFHLTVLKRLY